jgi:hypothetical protein
MFDVLEAVGMTEDILIETHGNNIVVGMRGTSYRVRYRRPMAVADSLWPTSCRRQMIH